MVFPSKITISTRDVGSMSVRCLPCSPLSTAAHRLEDDPPSSSQPPIRSYNGRFILSVYIYIWYIDGKYGYIHAIYLSIYLSIYICVCGPFIDGLPINSMVIFMIYWSFNVKFKRFTNLMTIYGSLVS